MHALESLMAITGGYPVEVIHIHTYYARKSGSAVSDQRETLANFELLLWLWTSKLPAGLTSSDRSAKNHVV